MAEAPLAVCDVCGRAMARKGDLLCGDCSRAFILMLSLLHSHPDIEVTDLLRIKEVFEWQTKRIGPLQSENGHPRAESQRQRMNTSAALSDIQQGQVVDACEVCGGALAESDRLLCVDCARAFTFVLELLHESAPLTQSRMEAHPELTADDLDRIREVFKWRSGKIGLGKPQPRADVVRA